MHIVDVTMFHAPASGGVRRYLEAKQHWLRGRHRHTLVVPGAHTSRTGRVWRVAAMRLPGSGGYRFALRQRPWQAALEALAPDVIEAGDPYVPGHAARAAARRLGVPAVAFYHSDLARLAERRLGGLGRRAAGLYLARLYDGFDLVLAPSACMLERLRGLGLTRVGQQPLGVDLERFHPRHRNPGFKAALGLPAHTRLLVFAGRYAAEKNIGVLIRAMAHLGRPYHLLLIGPGMPAVRQPNVTVWSGYVRGRLPAVIASADAFVHAGDQETFGLVVLEAMASGVPVVGCRAGAVAELVVPGTGVLARPRDPRALAGAVADVFDLGVERAGRAAREVAVTRWAWSAVLPGLIGHYRSLIGAQARRAPTPADASA